MTVRPIVLAITAGIVLAASLAWLWDRSQATVRQLPQGDAPTACSTCDARHLDLSERRETMRKLRDAQ